MQAVTRHILKQNHYRRGFVGGWIESKHPSVFSKGECVNFLESKVSTFQFGIYRRKLPFRHESSFKNESYYSKRLKSTVHCMHTRAESNLKQKYEYWGSFSWQGIVFLAQNFAISAVRSFANEHCLNHVSKYLITFCSCKS